MPTFMMKSKLTINVQTFKYLIQGVYNELSLKYF